MGDKERVYTVAEAAVKLGCTEETIRRAIRAKQLLAVREPVSIGLRYIIRESDLDTFVRRRATR